LKAWTEFSHNDVPQIGLLSSAKFSQATQLIWGEHFQIFENLHSHKTPTSTPTISISDL
jgi:hypothetical protein